MSWRLGGKSDSALEVLEHEVVPALHDSRNVLLIFNAKEQISRLLAATGQVTRALETLQEVVAPLEKARNARGLARVRTNIASFMLRLSQRDEALRLLREEAVPAWQQLKDKGQEALAKTVVADVLIARDEHEEALRLLREEVLPVWQQLRNDRQEALATEQDCRHPRCARRF